MWISNDFMVFKFIDQNMIKNILVSRDLVYVFSLNNDI